MSHVTIQEQKDLLVDFLFIQIFKCNISCSFSPTEELSPEMHPKRRPPVRQPSTDSNESIIIRRTKKRMILLDSDTDNSIILEHTKGRKQTCLKDTPLKVDSKSDIVNASMEFNENDVSDDDTSKNIDESQCNDDSQSSERINDSVGPDDSNVHDTTKNDDNESSDDDKSNSKDKLELSQQIDDLIRENGVEPDDVNDKTIDKTCDEDDEGVGNDEEDDGPDEDLMVMSRATRMSILGVIPNDDDSDADSDFIQSDEVRT